MDVEEFNKLPIDKAEKLMFEACKNPPEKRFSNYEIWTSMKVANIDELCTPENINSLRTRVENRKQNEYFNLWVTG